MVTFNNIIFDNLSEFEADFKEGYLNEEYSFDSLVESIKEQISNADSYVGDYFEYVFFTSVPCGHGLLNYYIRFDCRWDYETEGQNILRVRYKSGANL